MVKDTILENTKEYLLPNDKKQNTCFSINDQFIFELSETKIGETRKIILKMIFESYNQNLIFLVKKN